VVWIGLTLASGNLYRNMTDDSLEQTLYRDDAVDSLLPTADSLEQTLHRDDTVEAA
jgi:hypothetical protein